MPVHPGAAVWRREHGELVPRESDDLCRPPDDQGGPEGPEASAEDPEEDGESARATAPILGRDLVSRVAWAPVASVCSHTWPTFCVLALVILYMCYVVFINHMRNARHHSLKKKERERGQRGGQRERLVLWP